MKLYKYRSLENLEYTLDILLNQRLHCAPFDKLNDPFEGLFLSDHKTSGAHGFRTAGFGTRGFYEAKNITTTRSIAELPNPGKSLICSLSASKADVRLWSHYANGHTGIAIEVDICDKNDYLHEINYVKQLTKNDLTLLTETNSNEILETKTHHWCYEQEFRIISDQDYFLVNGKITGIYLGFRISTQIQEMILKILGGSIPVYSTKLNEKTIEIEISQHINK